VEASETSGATELHLIPEAIAAAVSVNFQLKRDRLEHCAVVNGRQEQNWSHILVLDCGGSAATASILEVVDDRYEMRGFCRNPDAGGHRFDDSLLELVLDQFDAQHRIYLRDFPETLPLVLAECEQAKIRLSRDAKTTIFVRSLVNGLDLKIKITRDEFEEQCYDVFNDVIATIRSALHEQRMSHAGIDAVFMVGGIASMPRLKSLIGRVFGREPIIPGDPGQAVGLGAAIIAEKLKTTPADEVRHTVYCDMCPLSLGLNGAGGAVYKFVFRGATLPVSDEGPFEFATNNTRRMVFSVYQGERVLEKDNRLLTTFVVHLPPAEAGAILIWVTMKLDRKGHIEIGATATMRGEPLEINVQTQADIDTNEYSVLELARMYSVAEAARPDDEREAEIGRRREAIQSYFDNMCGFFRGLDRDPILDDLVVAEDRDAFLQHLRQVQRCEGEVPTWDEIRQVKARARELLVLYFETRETDPPVWMR
jgi:L1 cell adhesion molecule like protein